MRIGFVTGEYPPMEGGVGAFTQELAKEMARQGNRIFILTREAANQPSQGGISVDGQVGRRWGWRTVQLVKAWVQCSQIEVVNVQFQTAAFDMHPAIQCLPAAGIPVPIVVTFHDLRPPYLFPKAGPLRERSVRWMARSATAIITTDREDQAYATEEWGIIDTHWIPIGSNVTAKAPDGYDRVSWRRKMGLSPSDLLICYFGFLNESKGAAILINALVELLGQDCPAHLVMIGGKTGSSDPANLEYSAHIDKLIADNQLSQHIYWTGFVSNEMVSSYFYASDVCVLPYLDGISLRRGTLMAALAHGCPIVSTTPQSRIPELEGSVDTVSPGAPHELAAQILRLWRDPDRRARLSKNALEASKSFTWSTIASQTLDLYRELL